MNPFGNGPIDLKHESHRSIASNSFHQSIAISITAQMLSTDGMQALNQGSVIPDVLSTVFEPSVELTVRYDQHLVEYGNILHTHGTPSTIFHPPDYA